ncbi:MAG: FecR family protein [Thermodesulfobacteriota bacterium]
MASLPAAAGVEMINGENEGVGAEVTCLVGRCFVVTPGLEPVRALAAGDRLAQGDRLRVADGSKIELRLGDDSLVRLDAGSVAVITSLSLDPSTGLRFVDIGIIMGKLWASVAKSPSVEDRFDVSTRTTVVSGRGAVFRMNVNDDQAAVIKVYDGAVEVKSTSSPAPGSASLDSDQTADSLDSARILEPGQEMAIHTDGSAAAPFAFSYDEDLTEWVKWNRERDGGGK